MAYVMWTLKKLAVGQPAQKMEEAAKQKVEREREQVEVVGPGKCLARKFGPVVSMV